MSAATHHSRALKTTKEHGIARPEWEQRFHAHIATFTVDPEGQKLHPETAAELSAFELESWTTDRDDWCYTLPEDAADEQMSNWQEDDGP